jgi:hypothetical protein
VLKKNTLFKDHFFSSLLLVVHVQVLVSVVHFIYTPKQNPWLVQRSIMNNTY